ncbi:MAG: DUF4065 domain-containing protein [Clostridium perfringens]|nr:DUF4065 domain-containing protein [Clostridium perfringens]MDU3375588.1 DUF4065 domain-containing protein [Clostridium perfringens]MDU3535773.1 DUF4065 domain-containing protein [Clostridium perfringens]HBI6974291.1 DUF4065 domain-containing protein [Clostridium perfringens]
MYSAIDVANHVVNFSLDNNQEITNLKLQKLLYYIEAAFLVERDESCIFQNFKCWRHGPVVPDVYTNFRVYLNKPIDEYQEESNINSEDIELINRVVSSNFRFDPWELVDRTHEEDPWLKTNSNETIAKSKIKEYFLLSDNRRRIYGEN